MSNYTTAILVTSEGLLGVSSPSGTDELRKKLFGALLSKGFHNDVSNRISSVQCLIGSVPPGNCQKEVSIRPVTGGGV